MLSQSNNRVQAIKSRFENLNSDGDRLLKKATACNKHLCNHNSCLNYNTHNRDECARTFSENHTTRGEKPENEEEKTSKSDSDVSSDESNPKPNNSYLYTRVGGQENACDTKKTALSRQTSDPGKKLHRSHAFRCDKSQKVSTSPKRHGSYNGRSESSEYTFKSSEKPKLSKDRLKKLGSLLEDRMRKENFAFTQTETSASDVGEQTTVLFNSVPDEQVPKHILDQYSKVLKPKRGPESPGETRHDTMTDSGVSSETENLDDTVDKTSRINKMKALFETASKTETITKPHTNNKTNLGFMNDSDLCSSSETMRLERKNPHVDLTDTLKKALKQPLPVGPPPKKPPRTFIVSPVLDGLRKTSQKRKDAKQMLDKLEQVLQNRETKNAPPSHIYDIAETDLSRKPSKNKEIHYLCTEILDITHSTLLPNQSHVSDSLSNCFNSLNCAIVPTRSTTSLPYTRLSGGSIVNRNSLGNVCCSCSADSLDLDTTEENRSRFSTFFAAKPNENMCPKCHSNFTKTEGFQCHLSCKCKMRKSEFFVPKHEHIYDVPNVEENSTKVCLDSNGGGVGKSIGGLGCDDGVSTKGSVGKGTVFNGCCSENGYGVLNSIKLNGCYSKSLEELRSKNGDILDDKIYDIPCDPSRGPSPDLIAIARPRSNVESLRRNFENGPLKDPNIRGSTPSQRLSAPAQATAEPKPVESREFTAAKKSLERRFATEVKRPRRFEKNGHAARAGTLVDPKRDRRDQIDVDKENLNRLMNEIYETVSAACRMEEPRTSRFPTDQSDGTSSEDSVKLTRSLTEKRKNYVRRVSSRVAYLDSKTAGRARYRHQTSVCSYQPESRTENPYSTFRSWKSFRNSQTNLSRSLTETMAGEVSPSDSKCNLTDSQGDLLTMKGQFGDIGDASDLADLGDLSLDDKAGCLDLDLPFEPKERGLFDVCLLVGLNYMTGQAYVKSVFPTQVTVPPHIENLVFPETLNPSSSQTRPGYDLDSSRTQTYSLVLTNERGERNYGYCRRVLPEGGGCCLPLCYCIIGRYRAPGFYYKVLQEIESHHGSTEAEIHCILEQLLQSEFPNPGEEIHLTCPPRPGLHHGRSKSSTLPEKCSSSELLLVDDSKPRSRELEDGGGSRVRALRRPLEPRVDEGGVSVLLDSLGASLAVKVFGSLLLERKVVIISDNLSQLSSCMEALQSILYPMVWQQPLISTIPSELRKDILEAPLPILAGMLRSDTAAQSWESDMEKIMFEEGMLIDLSHSSAKVVFQQGDESTILPHVSHKTLKATLQMEASRGAKKREVQQDKTRNVMIAEAFLRFFVDVLHDFWDHFAVGTPHEGDLGRGDVVFEKEKYIKSAPSKHNQYFLEWFTETAMFDHFVHNMAAIGRHSASQTEVAPLSTGNHTSGGLVDAPLPDYYELYRERAARRHARRDSKGDSRGDSQGKSNYKSAMNKKVKMLKSKLKDLIN